MESNPVWSTLGDFGARILDYSQAIRVAKASRPVTINAAPTTAAAPSGAPAMATFNPFPGLFGSYPQAEGKPQPGGAFNIASAMPILLLGGLAILVIALFARR